MSDVFSYLILFDNFSMFDVRCSSKILRKVLNTFRSKRESEKVLCDHLLQFIVQVFKLLIAINDF